MEHLAAKEKSLLRLLFEQKLRFKYFSVYSSVWHHLQCEKQGHPINFVALMKSERFSSQSVIVIGRLSYTSLALALYSFQTSFRSPLSMF